MEVRHGHLQHGGAPDQKNVVAKRPQADSFVVGSAASAERFLLGQKAFFVLSGVVSAIDLGFDRGFLVRDPDGHVMQLIEK